MSTTDPSARPSASPSEALAEFLADEHVAFKLIEHAPTLSAPEEARITHHPQDEVAKTVVLHDGIAYLIAAIPASRRLDLHKLRALLEATGRLRLASEEEIARAFPSLEVGAAPPFGPMLPAAEVIDESLLAPAKILCGAGDHRHSVLLDPRDVVRVTAARVADICED